MHGMMFADYLALEFLILCGSSLVGIVGWELFGPGRYTLAERFLYLPVYCLSRVLWRVEIRWAECYADRDDRTKLLSDRIAGGAVLVANHCSSMDPFFVQLCAGKRVHWMVASEYFKAPVVGSWLRWFEAIPTHRGGVDIASTKQAMAIARSGRFVGMFPEGRINRTGQPLMTVRPGAALVALRAGVPLIPIWIEGAPVGPHIFSALFRAARIRVLVGPPDKWGLQQQMAEPSVTTSEPTSRKSDRSDRALSAVWIQRVMMSSVQSSGRTSESIGMAGKRWLEEN